jgi:mannose-1-phosphate guanylyltransferase
MAQRLHSVSDRGYGGSVTGNRLWGIVLTGPTGERRRPRGRGPAARPAPPAARHVLLRRVLEGASRLIPGERLVAVLDRAHSASYATALADRPEVQRVVQPAYRGSAPALFVTALKIARQDPHATVVVLPTDGAMTGEARLMADVARAVRAVALRPDLPVVIGGHPGARDGGAGCWIEPGPAIEGLETLGIRAIERFVLRPSPVEVTALRDGDGLVNTHVVIARLDTLIALGARTAPDVLEALEPLAEAFGAPEESLMSEAVYEQMPYADLARVLFVRPAQFAVLAVGHVALWRETSRERLAS